MTPLEDAIATMLRDALDLEFSAGDVTACVAALDPATRDKMLLGFAVGPDDESWDLVHERPEAIPDDVPPYGFVVWKRDSGAKLAAGRGPTPLAAVEAALKEVDDD